MSGLLAVKTNFTSGQVSPQIFGRGDLSIFENGARTLQNVIIHPTGGVSRRCGLKFIGDLKAESRLVPFEFNTEQTYLLCFQHKKLQIYRNDLLITELESPWESKHLTTLSWTQSADTLLVVHPDLPPKQVSRYDNDLWKIEDWEYYSQDGKIYCPYFNYFQNKVKLHVGNEGSQSYAYTDTAVFSPEYVGSRIRVANGEVEIIRYVDPKKVEVKISHKVDNSNDSTDWEESAFSNRRGWPNSVTFHQDRMVIGGSKSLPNRLWLSKSSDLFNFDIGKGLDDEAIEFAILSDQVNAIKSVVSARHLLVFTTGAEWMVTGSPLTSENIELHRQTKVGMYTKHYIPPQNVDGATEFVSASGRQLREFLFADVEQAYQAKDLTLLSGEILRNPRDGTFLPDENVLYMVLEDGTISALTNYRSEQVNAWSKLLTAGKFISAAVIGEDIYFCVKRGDKYFLEKKSEDFWVDSGVKLSASQPQKVWQGLERFNNQNVIVEADGFTIGEVKIENSVLELSEPASEITIGYGYEHIIEPLPFMVDSTRPYPPKSLRVVGGIFRIIDSRSFRIDFGNGYFEVPLKKMYKDKILDAPAHNFNGDIQLHSIGWIKDMEKPLWSIKSSVPTPFNLLSAVIEIKIKN